MIRELKGGRVEFRNDRTGNVHSVIGKKSFTEEQIRDNLLRVRRRAECGPSRAAIKGVYCKSLSISTAMAPGVALNVQRDGAGGIDRRCVAEAAHLNLVVHENRRLGLRQSVAMLNPP